MAGDMGGCAERRALLVVCSSLFQVVRVVPGAVTHCPQTGGLLFASSSRDVLRRAQRGERRGCAPCGREKDAPYE